MKNKNKGFTLIELLVVIAVIGILAAVILAALGQARDRGKVSTVQQELSSMRSQAEVFFGLNSGVYTNMCTADTKVAAALADAMAQFVPGDTPHLGTAAQQTSAANTNRRAVCRSNLTQWAISIPISLNTAGDVTSFWCVDSNGASKLQTTTIANNVFQCP